MGRISESDVRDNEDLHRPSQKVIEKKVEKTSEKDKTEKEDQGSKSSNHFSTRLRNQKRPIISGLVVLLPMLAVFMIVSWLLQKISVLPGSHLLNMTNIYIVNQSLKLGLIIGIGGLIASLTGKMVETEKGLQIERSMDRFFSSIPFLGPIHRITKVTAETVASGARELRRPVKIEIQGMKVTAFKTGNQTEEGREILFLPTSPNITTGVVLEVRPEKIIETNETGEQALVRTLSAGFGQHRDSE